MFCVFYYPLKIHKLLLFWGLCHPVTQSVTPSFSLSLFFFFFLGLHPRHMEGPRLGVESELQLPAYPTATATQDPSHICDLHHSSQQRQKLNPLSEARDQTGNLMVPSWIHFLCARTGTPAFLFMDAPAAYASSQARGRTRAAAAGLCMAQPQQHGNQAASVTYAAAHGNARSLTHSSRLGIKPASSWTRCQVLNPPSHSGNSSTSLIL